MRTSYSYTRCPRSSNRGGTSACTCSRTVNHDHISSTVCKEECVAETDDSWAISVACQVFNTVRLCDSLMHVDMYSFTCTLRTQNRACWVHIHVGTHIPTKPDHVQEEIMQLTMIYVSIDSERLSNKRVKGNLPCMKQTVNFSQTAIWHTAICRAQAAWSRNISGLE